MLLAAALCRFLSSFPLVSFHDDGSVLTRANIVIGFFFVTVRWVAAALDSVNDYLRGTPFRLRRFRVESFRISVRLALPPIRIHVASPDCVVALHSEPPSLAAGKKAWKDDILFLDMVVRLARRNAFVARARRSRTPADRTVARTSWLTYENMFYRLWTLLNWLVRVEVTDLAFRFEDAEPLPLYSNVLGFGFTTSVTCQNLISSAVLQTESDLATGGYHRVVRITGLKGFYCAGLLTSLDGVNSLTAPPPTPLFSNSADIPASACLSDGTSPILLTKGVEAFLRLGEYMEKIDMRVVFTDELTIALSDLQFQSGLAAILRIPQFFSSRLAVGAADDLGAEPSDSNTSLSKFDTRARERYFEFYRSACRRRCQGQAWSDLIGYEQSLSLDECLCLRRFAERLDLRELWASFGPSSGGSQGCEQVMSDLLLSFEKRFKLAEAGVKGVAANDWGPMDAEVDNPELSLSFVFRVVTVLMYSSARMNRSGSRSPPEMRCEMKNAHIAVFDAIARCALVVSLIVGSFIAKGSDGYYIIRGMPRTEADPLINMRFRQDGLLSPSQQSVRYTMNGLDVFGIGDKLGFILKYFVPVESPHSLTIRRPITKTIALARRERARKSNILLPLRCVEHSAIADVSMSDVICHVAESHVDSAFFVASREARWRAEHGGAVRGPMTTTCIARFDALFIESCPPPLHRLDTEENFVVNASPIGIEMEELFWKDPAPVDGQHHVANPGHHGNEAYDQISALRLEIRGITVDLIVIDGRGRAEEENILRKAHVECTFVYIGMPFTSAYRSDSYLDVDFSNCDVQIRAESIWLFIDLVKAVIRPILELSETLMSAIYPPEGMSADQFAKAVEDSTYGKDLGVTLAPVLAHIAILRSVRRIVGDLHVRLRQARLVLVHSKAERRWSAGRSSAPGGKAFMEMMFGDSFIRYTLYSSWSSRMRVSITDMSWDVSRGPESVRRAYFRGLPFSMLSTTVARPPWPERSPPPIHAQVSLRTGAVKVMAQSASLVTFADLCALCKPIVAGRSARGDAPSHGFLDANRIAGPSTSMNGVISDGFFDLSREGDFMLSMLDEEGAELGLAEADSVMNLCMLEAGSGTALRFSKSTDGDDNAVWRYLRASVVTGSGKTNVYLVEDINHKVGLQAAVPEAKSPGARWRFFGQDSRHVALQCSSGRFMGIEQVSRRCVTSSKASFFVATIPRPSLGARGGTQEVLALDVSVAAFALHFGGGGSGSAYVPASSRAPPSSPPGVLQLDVTNISGIVKKHRDAARTEARLWGSLGLFYNNMNARPVLSVPVLLPWRFSISSSMGNHVIIHGDPVRVRLSNIGLLKIVSALRNHEDDSEEDDASYFSFANYTDQEIRFRVLGQDANPATPSDGPVLVVKSLERLPFSLPPSVLEMRESLDSSSASRVKKTLRSRALSSWSNRGVRTGDHVCSVAVDDYAPAQVSFGSVGSHSFRLSPQKVSERSRPIDLTLHVLEDEKRGTIRLELHSAVALKNHLPVSVDLLKPDTNGRLSSEWRGVPGMSELGLSDAAFVESMGIRIDGATSSTRLKVADLISREHSGDVYFVDGAALGSRSNLSEVVRASSSSFQYFSPIQGMPTRMVLSNRFDDSRCVLHLAPLMVIQNNLSSLLDIWVDDGIAVPTGGTGTHRLPRWVTGLLRSSRASYGRELLIYAFRVLPGAAVPIFNRSPRGEYRLLLREPGGAWTEPVAFAVSSAPCPGKWAFRTSVSIERGLVDVIAEFDDRCSLRIRVCSRFVIKNCVPGLIVSFGSTMTSGNPAPVRAASKALKSLGRQNARRNIFDITAGNFMYFNESEAYVGVRDHWSRRVLRFPEAEGESQIVRLPSSPSPGGIQLVVEAVRDHELRIHSLIEIMNTLDVPLEIDSVPGTHAVPVRVAPEQGAPFHQPHALLDSVLTSSKLRVVVSSHPVFFKSGPVYLSETGTYPLSVKCPSGYSSPMLSGHGLQTNCRYVVIGVDVFVDDVSGRRAVRFLRRPRYGPAFQVTNYSQYNVLLSDDIASKEPLCRAIGGGSTSSFAWSAVYPSKHPKRRVLYAWLETAAEQRRSSIREVKIPSLRQDDSASGTRPEGSVSVIAFEIPSRVSGDFRDGTDGVIYHSLGFRFSAGNGFMSTMSIYDITNPPSSDRLNSREIGIEAAVDSIFGGQHVGSSVHLALPRVELRLQLANSDLALMSLTGVYGQFLQTQYRLKLGLDVIRVELNNLRSATQKPVFMRATGGRGVDSRSPVVALRTMSRLPHTRLNPSDLLHFEIVELRVQPLIAQLEAKFVDEIGMYIIDIVRHIRKADENSGAEQSVVAMDVRTSGEEVAGVDGLSFWRVPLYFERCAVTDFMLNLSFEPNGHISFVSNRDDQSKSLTVLVRQLILRTMPPIKNAQLRLRVPNLSNSTYLSGELWKELVSHTAKQSLRILRSLLGNVRILQVIEGVVLGRKKGEQNKRRIGRALAFAKRTTGHGKKVMSDDGDDQDDSIVVEAGSALLTSMASEEIAEDGIVVVEDWIRHTRTFGRDETC